MCLDVRLAHLQVNSIESIKNDSAMDIDGRQYSLIFLRYFRRPYHGKSTMNGTPQSQCWSRSNYCCSNERGRAREIQWRKETTTSSKGGEKERRCDRQKWGREEDDREGKIRRKGERRKKGWIDENRRALWFNFNMRLDRNGGQRSRKNYKEWPAQFVIGQEGVHVEKQKGVTRNVKRCVSGTRMWVARVVSSQYFSHSWGLQIISCLEFDENTCKTA